MHSIVALTRIRNEGWVLGYSLRVLLSWADHVVIMLHACMDDSEQIARDVAKETGRVTVLEDAAPDWSEMRQLNLMLSEARSLGAKAIAINDGDEILTANLVPHIRGMVELLEPGEMLRVPWLNLWRNLSTWRDDLSKHGKQWLPLVFRDHPSLRWPDAEQFNHRSPFGIAAEKEWPAERGAGGVMHLQRVVWRRAEARQRLYKLREALRGAEPLHVIDARYSSSLAEEGAVLKQVDPFWWSHGLDRGLIDLDAEPWEIKECERLLLEHGADKFIGLVL